MTEGKLNQLNQEWMKNLVNFEMIKINRELGVELTRY